MLSTTTREAANATVSDAKTTAYSAKRDFSNAAEDEGNDFALTANKAGRKVRSFIETANDEITDVSEKMTTEIRTNPVRSSAIALGVGFMLAVLLRR